MMLKSELKYDQRLLEVNQLMSYQGVLGNYYYVGINGKDL